MTSFTYDETMKDYADIPEDENSIESDPVSLRQQNSAPHTQQQAPELPPRPENTSEKLQSQLKQVEHRLNEEQQAKKELQQELGDIRARWKETVKEFNRFQAESQTFVQLDDQELIQKVSQLRFNIRNFVLQHFESGQPLSMKDSRACLNNILRYYPNILGSFEEFEYWMQIPPRRTMVIRAFLWAFLQRDIFGEFRWAGKDVAGTFYHMRKALGSFLGAASGGTPDEIQAQRKFHTWKANTTTLVAEWMKLDHQEGRKEREEFSIEKAKEICSYLAAFSTSKDKELASRIADIIIEALDLDLLLSKQAACVQWWYGAGQETQRFDPESMDLEGEVGDHVYLYLAPAVLKQGKSNGESFDRTNLLLKMQVVCQPIEALVQPGVDQGPDARKSFRSQISRGFRHVRASQS
ncbi:hypothetical protein F5Y06DRAFT_119873 [Hypoxylon sp. FL0890]|nr:hypothetical protein F5Y06DRAFT_119873 [Hypoxylon sp. FL0890]